MTQIEYQVLAKHYPSSDGAGGFDRIGGQCASYENQCAIRLSRALQLAGFSLEGSEGFGPSCAADSVDHVRGAKPLADFLWKKLGRPRIAQSPGSAKAMGIAGKTGIIFFKDVYSRDDGSSGHHIDLWDGASTRGYDGFGTASEVWFWDI